MAKAFIASTELGIQMLPTAWGLNDRGYRNYFGRSRFDWVRLWTLSKVLPAHTFREADYIATGEKDFGSAIRVYAESTGLDTKRNYVLKTEGLWGGYYAIRQAKPFILQSLYGTRYTVRNLYDFQKRTENIRLLIAVHIRMTDFFTQTEETNYRGLWNTRICLKWYTLVCRSLRDALGGTVRFLLMTDGSPHDVREFLDEFQPLTTFDQDHRAVSDLLLMAGADALVCSISSYSQWAAFLSNSPYLWYRPHLTTLDNYLRIWDSVGESADGDGVEHELYPRGVPVGEKGDVPDWLVDYLRMRGSLNRVSLDLVRGGGVPSACV